MTDTTKKLEKTERWACCDEGSRYIHPEGSYVRAEAYDELWNHYLCLLSQRERFNMLVGLHPMSEFTPTGFVRRQAEKTVSTQFHIQWFDEDENCWQSQETVDTDDVDEALKAVKQLIAESKREGHWMKFTKWRLARVQLNHSKYWEIEL